MTQADSVHSTPLTNTSKIDLYPDRSALTGLESAICDCHHMAELAAIVVDQHLADNKTAPTEDEIATVMFAVYQLTVMVRVVHKKFYASLKSGAAEAVA